jgi:hypothetical protein
MPGSNGEPEWDYWVLMDEWTLVTAICLLLRVDPDSWVGKHITDMKRPSEMLSTDSQRRTWDKAKQIWDLAWASHNKGTLTIARHTSIDGFVSPPDLTPYEWVQWARSKNLPIPEELNAIPAPRVVPPTAQETLHPKERDTLLKLVIGLAIKGFDYDPSALRSTAVKEICAALDGLGIGMDEDTVRNKLKDGAKLLPY